MVVNTQHADRRIHQSYTDTCRYNKRHGYFGYLENLLPMGAILFIPYIGYPLPIDSP